MVILDENQEESERLKKSGKSSIYDGFFAGAMNGFGDRYISAYALFLGASNFLIALIATVPGLLGNFSQLYSVDLMKKYSRKKVIVLNSFIQALLWIPLLLIGVLYYFYEGLRFFSPIFLLIVYSILIIIGSLNGPIWNSWMRDLVNANKGRYFGIRNLIANIAIIISMLIAGVILNFFNTKSALIGFVIIFAAAALGRMISVYFLTKQYEPKFVYDEKSYFGFREFASKMRYNNFGRFVIFVSLISFATAIAGPFFVVYELNNLGLSYFSFTLINLSAIVTTIIFLPFWGIFSDKYGNVRVLKYCGLLVGFVPILWIFSIFIQNNVVFLVTYLICIELFSGIVWSGFNLAASNFIYDAVTKQRMAICVAYFNFINAFSAFVGSLIGTLLSLWDFSFGFVNGFLFIFLISGILRFIILFVMSSQIKEVKTVEGFDIKTHIKKQFQKIGTVFWRDIGFKPIRIIE